MRRMVLAAMVAAACGTGPADNPFRVEIAISSVFSATDCVVTWQVSSAVGDTGLRVVYHVWLGPDTGSQSDAAFFIRLGVTEARSLARPGTAQPMKWELSVTRPRPGFSDPSSPDFGNADQVWAGPYGGDYRRFNGYTCGTTWTGI